MKTLFISDLHLSAETPVIATNFLALLGNTPNEFDALYILGDLFEYWLGDDGISSAHQPIIHAIRQVSDSGTPVYFMHGNRDFLIADEFANQSGCTILQDPSIIDLYGVPTLLMHGDTLCTDDHAYMAFREQVRNPLWQQHFLGLDMPKRIEMAKQARDASAAAAQNTSAAIMDVNTETVNTAMTKANISLLIHGHTHRPAIHDFDLNGSAAKRMVLGDWGKEASYLLVDANTFELSDARFNAHTEHTIQSLNHLRRNVTTQRVF